MTKAEAQRIRELKRSISLTVRMIKDTDEDEKLLAECLYPKASLDAMPHGSGRHDSPQERLILTQERQRARLERELAAMQTEYCRLLEDFQTFCQTITPQQAMILSSRYVKGMTVEATAARFGLSISTVKAEAAKAWRQAADNGSGADPDGRS